MSPVLFLVFLLPFSAENLSIEKKIQNESIDTLILYNPNNLRDGWMEEKEREQQKARNELHLIHRHSEQTKEANKRTTKTRQKTRGEKEKEKEKEKGEEIGKENNRKEKTRNEL